MSILIIILSVAGAVAASCWLENWLGYRRRIVHWLHERGCEAQVIRRAQVGRVGWDPRQPCYYVEYTRPDGTARRRLCLMPRHRLQDHGLFWRDITEDDLLPGDWQCFECRARIPKGGTVCPRCGWS